MGSARTQVQHHNKIIICASADALLGCMHLKVSIGANQISSDLFKAS